MNNYVNTPCPERPNEAPELKPAEVDRARIIGRDGLPFGKSWFEDEPDGATWPGHHMAGGVAVPLKPKTKSVWGRPPYVDDEDEQHPEARSSGQQRTEQGAGSGKGEDESLPDIGKLSMAEKKDDMDVDKDIPRTGLRDAQVWDVCTQTSGY